MSTSLIQLTPEQIADRWADISVAVAASLPPTAEDSADVMKHILSSMLMGDMQCWIGIDGDKIVAVATTYIMYDPVVKTKILVLYTIYSPPGRSISYELWQHGFRVLIDYSKDQHCDKMIAYTNVPKIVKMATNGLGGKAEYTILTWEN